MSLWGADLRRRVQPPRLGRSLLASLLPPRDREFVLGDLEEQFQSVVDSHVGLRGARRWYWKQIYLCLVRRGEPKLPRSRPPKMREAGIMETLGQDLRYGLRTLRRSPGFTAAAVTTLALGIGANTAIFSVVHAVILRPLPYRDVGRIMTLWESNQKDGIPQDDVSPANYLDWAQRQTAFEKIAASRPYSFDYVGGGMPEAWRSSLVTEGFFEILGASPLIGRTFLAEEYQPGKGNVVLLTHGIWQQKFGGDPAVVGRTLRLAAGPTLVVGVLPPEFHPQLRLPEPAVYQPQGVDESWKFQRRATYLEVVGRLKAGVTPARAQAAMDTVAAQLGREYPQTNAGMGVLLVPLREHLVGKVRPALIVLLAAVGLVLLIACANVAGLILARGFQRERDIGIRAALGAGRGRIIRQLLTERGLLSLGGCLGGVLLAWWGIRGLKALSPAGISRMDTVSLDPAVLAFAATMSLATALLFGLAPALQLSRARVIPSQAASPRGAGSLRSRSLRSRLVVAEIALALVLLTGAGLFLRSFVNLLSVDAGFEREHLIAMQAFVWDRVETPEQRIAYARDVLGKLEALPGVEAAGLTTALPFLDSSSVSSIPLAVQGESPPPAGEEPTAFFTVATESYFRALRIPLLKGRLFTPFDRLDAPPVMIVNQELARRFKLGSDPIGKRIIPQLRSHGAASAPRAYEIVGLVGSLRHEGLDSDPRPEFFIPHAQNGSGSVIFVVRTAADPLAMIQAAKTALWKVSSSQPIYEIATIDQLVSGSLSERRFNLILLAAFALLALILATIGIYGVMSLATTQRTYEIGLRMALGAQRAEVLWLVLGGGLRLALAGIAIGTLAALAANRLLRGFLFGVTTTDPATYTAIAALLLLVGLLACFAPARRATRIDPVAALRCE